MADHSQNEGLC